MRPGWEWDRTATQGFKRKNAVSVARGGDAGGDGRDETRMRKAQQ